MKRKNLLIKGKEISQVQIKAAQNLSLDERKQDSCSTKELSFRPVIWNNEKRKWNIFLILFALILLFVGIYFFQNKSGELLQVQSHNFNPGSINLELNSETHTSDLPCTKTDNNQISQKKRESSKEKTKKKKNKKKLEYIFSGGDPSTIPLHPYDLRGINRHEIPEWMLKYRYTRREIIEKITQRREAEKKRNEKAVLQTSPPVQKDSSSKEYKEREERVQTFIKSSQGKLQKGNLQIFTKEELRQHNGQQLDLSTLLSIRGMVKIKL